MALSRNLFWEGGAGERVQGARAAYGTCFICADQQGARVIPDSRANRLFSNFVTLREDLGIKSPSRRFMPVSGSDQEKGSDVLEAQDRARFEQLVLPHLDAAFNLARWLLRSRADSEDVAQEAMLRAYRFFRGFHGDAQPSASPEALAIAGDNRERLTRALETLPPRFREVLVLRELEGCSYKEIAAITAIPIGTVMSALARARQRLQRALTHSAPQEAPREL